MQMLLTCEARRVVGLRVVQRSHLDSKRCQGTAYAATLYKDPRSDAAACG